MTRYFVLGAVLLTLFALSGCASGNPDVYGLNPRLQGTVGKPIAYVKRYIKVFNCPNYEEGGNCHGAFILLQPFNNTLSVTTTRSELGNSYVYSWETVVAIFAPACRLEIFADKETGIVTNWNYNPPNATHCLHLIGQLPARHG